LVCLSATQALAVLKTSPQDLVLTDLRMPGMSGIDLLRGIRELHPEVTVVLVTAFGSVESAAEATMLGAYDYITKPVNPDALRQTVRRALRLPVV
jgi:DNA-binding NtrC family response regulator